MDRDPPHYLSPLSTTTTPKRLLWLACRGYVSRRREHHELHFQAAALGRTWYSGKAKQRKDTLDVFDDPAALWEAVAAWCPVGRRVVLFTYDLPEQMRLSQLLSHLPQDGWSLDKIVLESKAAWCLLRKDKRSLMCCDLRSWAPVAWNKLRFDIVTGGTLPLGLLAGSSYPGVSAIDRVAVIREATLQILNWLEGENLGQFRPTGSGQSLTAYRRRFIRHRLLVHDDSERLRAERLAMYTGRAEAWRVGRLRRGPYIEYDLHSAYATIGRDCEVPTVARGSIRNPSNARVARAMDNYAVLADVTVDTEVECVPYKVGERILWPIGKFRSMLWDPELQLALQYCTGVKIHRAWLYDRAPALREFCSYVLDNMEAQTQIYGLVPQRVLKHWSRCLVGRLGLRYRSWHRFGPQDPPDVRLVTYLDLDDGTSTDMLLAGTTRLLLGDMTESRESLPQVPGWIMSECRARLWSVMLLYHHQLVYCDTDSVILAGPGNVQNGHLYCGYDYGKGWLPKGAHNVLTIHGPRNLEVGSSRRVAGLPLSARRTAPLTFEGEVMRGVKHAMRNGELDLVSSIPRTFHLHAEDTRRQHNPDGSTSPYRLEEACL